jgi:hypothetical protein
MSGYEVLQFVLVSSVFIDFPSAELMSSPHAISPQSFLVLGVGSGPQLRDAMGTVPDCRFFPVGQSTIVFLRCDRHSVQQ